MFHTEFYRHPKHQLVPCSEELTRWNSNTSVSFKHSQAEQQAQGGFATAWLLSRDPPGTRTPGKLWSEQDSFSRGFGVGLQWTHSPKSVFLVFFLISLKDVFNPLRGTEMFKDQTWKERENPNKPSALAVQDGIGMKECWNENCNNFRVKSTYIALIDLKYFGAWSSQHWIWKEWNIQKNTNFPNEAQSARTCSTWNISGKYHYKPLLKSRKFNFLCFLTCTLQCFVCPFIKNARFSIKLNGGKDLNLCFA